MCPPTPNLYVGVLIPNVMIFGGETFGRSLGHESVDHLNEISTLIKETPEGSLFASAM